MAPEPPCGSGAGPTGPVTPILYFAVLSHLHTSSCPSIQDVLETNIDAVMISWIFLRANPSPHHHLSTFFLSEQPKWGCLLSNTCWNKHLHLSTQSWWLLHSWTATSLLIVIISFRLNWITISFMKLFIGKMTGCDTRVISRIDFRYDHFKWKIRGKVDVCQNIYHQVFWSNLANDEILFQSCARWQIGGAERSYLH